MPILSSFYTVVIPIENLKRVLTEEELQRALAEKKYKTIVRFDDYLYCESTMSPHDNEVIVKYWESKGLAPIELVNGEEHWKDLCLVATPDSQPTAPCEWVEIFSVDGYNSYINLKGKPRDCLVKEISSVEEFANLLNKKKLVNLLKTQKAYLKKYIETVKKTSGYQK